jgi:hypothetical protein
MYDTEAMDAVDDLEKALDKLVAERAHTLHKSLDDVWTDLDHAHETLSAHTRALGSQRFGLDDLEARVDQLTKSTTKLKKRLRRVEREEAEAPEPSSSAFEDLAKALCPLAAPSVQQRIADLAKAHVVSNAARPVKFDREWASTLRVQHRATPAEMQVWQLTHLLHGKYPPPTPIRKALQADVDAWRFHPDGPHPQSLLDAPAEVPLSGPELRKGLSGSSGEIMYTKPSSLLDNTVGNVWSSRFRADLSGSQGPERTDSGRPLQPTTHEYFISPNPHESHGLGRTAGSQIRGTSARCRRSRIAPPPAPLVPEIPPEMDRMRRLRTRM